MATGKDKPADNGSALPADADAPGNAEMQKRMDEATEKGFLGVEVDDTPNEAYTVQGVTSGQPTPETDPQRADDAAAYQRRLAGPGNGPGPR